MTIHAMGAEDDGEVVGYMCAIDWECELGMNMDGNRIWPSLEDAKRGLRCAESCGVVEVRVRYQRLALRGTSEIAPTERTERTDRVTQRRG